jgi:hypothetical protein
MLLDFKPYAIFAGIPYENTLKLDFLIKNAGEKRKI